MAQNIHSKIIAIITLFSFTLTSLPPSYSALIENTDEVVVKFNDDSSSRKSTESILKYLNTIKGSVNGTEEGRHVLTTQFLLKRRNLLDRLPFYKTFNRKIERIIASQMQPPSDPSGCDGSPEKPYDLAYYNLEHELLRAKKYATHPYHPQVAARWKVYYEALKTRDAEITKLFIEYLDQLIAHYQMLVTKQQGEMMTVRNIKSVHDALIIAADVLSRTSIIATSESTTRAMDIYKKEEALYDAWGQLWNALASAYMGAHSSDSYPGGDGTSTISNSGWKRINWRTMEFESITSSTWCKCNYWAVECTWECNAQDPASSKQICNDVVKSYDDCPNTYTYPPVQGTITLSVSHVGDYNSVAAAAAKYAEAFDTKDWKINSGCANSIVAAWKDQYNDANAMFSAYLSARAAVDQAAEKWAKAKVGRYQMGFEVNAAPYQYDWGMCSGCTYKVTRTENRQQAPNLSPILQNANVTPENVTLNGNPQKNIRNPEIQASASASDPEGDRIIYRWHVDEIPRSSSGLAVSKEHGFGEILSDEATAKAVPDMAGRWKFELYVTDFRVPYEEPQVTDWDLSSDNRYFYVNASRRALRVDHESKTDVSPVLFGSGSREFYREAARFTGTVNGNLSAFESVKPKKEVLKNMPVDKIIGDYAGNFTLQAAFPMQGRYDGTYTSTDLRSPLSTSSFCSVNINTWVRSCDIYSSYWTYLSDPEDKVEITVKPDDANLTHFYSPKKQLTTKDETMTGIAEIQQWMDKYVYLNDGNGKYEPVLKGFEFEDLLITKISDHLPNVPDWLERLSLDTLSDNTYDDTNAYRSSVDYISEGEEIYPHGFHAYGFQNPLERRIFLNPQYREMRMNERNICTEHGFCTDNFGLTRHMAAHEAHGAWYDQNINNGLFNGDGDRLFRNDPLIFYSRDTNVQNENPTGLTGAVPVNAVGWTANMVVDYTFSGDSKREEPETGRIKKFTRTINDPMNLLNSGGGCDGPPENTITALDMPLLDNTPVKRIEAEVFVLGDSGMQKMRWNLENPTVKITDQFKTRQKLTITIPRSFLESLKNTPGVSVSKLVILCNLHLAHDPEDYDGDWNVRKRFNNGNLVSYIRQSFKGNWRADR